jgi:hypothetical protein
MTISITNMPPRSGGESPHPDLYRWYAFQDVLKLEARQSFIKKLTVYVDRAIESNLAVPDLLNLTAWLGDKYDLIDNLIDALTPPENTRVRAIEILSDWLPGKLIEFRPMYRTKMKTDEHGNKNIEPAGKYIKFSEQLKNFLYFAPLDNWQKFSNVVSPWSHYLPIQLGLEIDEIKFINLIDSVIREYQNPSRRLSRILTIVYALGNTPKIRYIIGAEGYSQIKGANTKTTNRGREEISEWLEKRLERWVRITLPTKCPYSVHALINLVKFYLNQRIEKDVNSEIYQLGKLDSLDKSYHDEDSSKVVGDDIACDRNIDPLEYAIAQWQQAEHQKKVENSWQSRFIQYVNTDPNKCLREKHYYNPECHHQYLLQKLILPEKLGWGEIETISDIARKFNITRTALDDYLKDNFTPCIDGLYLDILTSEEWNNFKEKLEFENRDDLIDIHRKGSPQCNVWDLAKQLLPCYQQSPRSWEDIASDLKNSGWKRATPDYVKKYWTKTCLPILGKIAHNFLVYPPV